MSSLLFFKSLIHSNIRSLLEIFDGSRCINKDFINLRTSVHLDNKLFSSPIIISFSRFHHLFFALYRQAQRTESLLPAFGHVTLISELGNRTKRHLHRILGSIKWQFGVFHSCKTMIILYSGLKKAVVNHWSL